MKDVDPKPPARRYKRENPGDMIHLDIRKPGRFNRVGHRIAGDRRGQSNARGIGREHIHVCVDNASRIAFTDVLPDEKAISCWNRALAYWQLTPAWPGSQGLRPRQPLFRLLAIHGLAGALLGD